MLSLPAPEEDPELLDEPEELDELLEELPPEDELDEELEELLDELLLELLEELDELSLPPPPQAARPVLNAIASRKLAEFFIGMPLENPAARCGASVFIALVGCLRR